MSSRPRARQAPSSVAHRRQRTRVFTTSLLEARIAAGAGLHDFKWKTVSGRDCRFRLSSNTLAVRKQFGFLSYGVWLLAGKMRR